MKPTIAIFIHDPHCETECALGTITALVRDFDIRTFGIEDLTFNFLLDFDAVCFPGGMGDADDFYSIFNAEHISAVQAYIKHTDGKYLGICMGAYWAGPDYFNITTDLVIGQYIERATSDIDTDGATVANVTWLDNLDYMYFYDGCAIIGDDIDVYATYDNGDAMAAIQGNVAMIGCHPEAQPNWYTEGELPEYYYSPHHAQLMTNFVKDLINE
jgi:glutamine amidotransferase-like uncharacterized protein